MSDTTFLPSSPWMTDHYLSKEVFLPTDCDLPSDLPFDTLDNDLYPGLSAALESSRSDWGPPSSCQSDWGPHSSDISVANSECSEELSVDLDRDMEDFMMRTGDGFLTSSLVNHSGESSQINENVELTPEEDLSELQPGFSDDDDYMLCSDSCPNSTDLSCSKKAAQRKRTYSETLSRNINWSLLGTRGQHQLVEDLSSIISTYLGLREQLEVIRIINPHANVSPTDTEFVIDITNLDDNKLKLVQEFVRQHTQEIHSGSGASTRARKDSHRGRHRDMASDCSFHDNVEAAASSSVCGEVTSTCHRKATKQSQPKSQQRGKRPNQRKRNRQQMKEKRSGLFVKEEVLAMSCDISEEDDVDILT